MPDVQAQIARLQAENARLEALLIDLEADILDIERELDPFIKRYNRLVKPKTDRIDVIRQLIADLEKPPPAADATVGWEPPPGYVPVEEQYRRTWVNPAPSEPERTSDTGNGRTARQEGPERWTPAPDYVPVEEQFRRTWRRPAAENDAPDVPPAPRLADLIEADNPQALKQVYRRLVRRFHPDLATNPDERQRRHNVMVEINDAYSRRDLGALLALDDHPPEMPVDQPLAAIQLHQLQQINRQLEDRLAALRQTRHDLLNSDLVNLKLEATLLRRQGRDLLLEMAAKLELEYKGLLDQLDRLRGM